MEKRIYSIGGTRWYQEQLTYEEVGKAAELLSSFSNFFDAEKLSFGEIAKKIYDAGLVPELFRLILKPYYPGIVPILLHWLFRLLNRVSRNNLARQMKLEEMFSVLADFFFINTEWMERLLSSGEPSDGRMEAMSVMQALTGITLPSKISSSSSPEATSPESIQQNASSATQKP
jgi:hypothetical protein